MRVVAVVVTFNRLELLQTLVARLREVPEVDEILVIDNASSDGTGEWLGFEAPRCARRTSTSADDSISADASTSADDSTDAALLYRTLAENGGGAGGFHDGLEWAVERGADLVWLMDDDGLPDQTCLATLLERAADFDFWGPVVVDEAQPERLVFPIRLPGGTRVVHRMVDVEAAAIDGVIKDVVIPFNGVLVTRELVEQIGLPRAEFFIWGDDHEYRLRAEKSGGRVGTVVGARVLHPSVGELGTPMMFGRTTYNYSPSDLKHYCMARNNLVNLRDYRGWLHALAFVVKTLWFYLFTRPNPQRIGLSARAMVAGVRGDFTGHRRFLR
ncbi:hypothetical protein GCM10027020_03120 [Nocardioides salsibiostraticola]